MAQRGSGGIDTLRALTKRLESSGPAPVHLLQGEESLLVQEAARAIVEAAVGDPDDPMAVTRLDVEEPGVGAREVVAACRSPGLFASRQAVRVRGADALAGRKEDREELARYAAEPEPTTTLVLIAGKLDGKLQLVKRIREHDGVHTFQPLDRRQVPRWLVDEAKRQGHALDEPTGRLITDLVGSDLQRLRRVVEQLSLYVGPGQPISREAVEELLVATRSHGIFELVDAVGEGKLVDALRHLDAMLAQRESPLRILGMLIRHFRMLWQVAEARADGETLEAMRKRLQIHEFVAKKLWGQSERFRASFLRRIYDRLHHTDRALKSSGLDDALVLEQLVRDLCAR